MVKEQDKAIRILYSNAYTYKHEKLPSYTFYGGLMLYLFLLTFFFAAAHFHLGGR